MDTMERSELGRSLSERLAVKYPNLHAGALQRWIESLLSDVDGKVVCGLSIATAMRHLDRSRILDDLEREIVGTALLRVLTGRLYVFLAGVASVGRRVLEAAEVLDFDGPTIPLVVARLDGVDLHSHAPFSPDMRQFGAFVPECLIPLQRVRVAGWSGFSDPFFGADASVDAGACAERVDGDYRIIVSIDVAGELCGFNGGARFPSDWLTHPGADDLADLHLLRLRMLLISHAIASRAVSYAIAMRECGPASAAAYRSICEAEGLPVHPDVERGLGSWADFAAFSDRIIHDMIDGASRMNAEQLEFLLKDIYDSDGRLPTVGVWASDWFREWIETEPRQYDAPYA